MGVVYSSLDIECEKFPTQDDHTRAADAVLDLVSDVPGVELTMVHGSVAEGRSNLRSDLDLLVTYSADGTDEARLVREVNCLIEEVGADTDVAIETNIWPVDEPPAARRERMYDLLFSRHLAHSMQVNETWRRGEPDRLTIDIADELAEATVKQVARIAVNYTIYKHGGFAKAPRGGGYSVDDSRALAAMQRALEFPKSVGRKVEQLAGLPGYNQDYEEYWAALADAGLSKITLESLRVLRTVDKECTQIIDAFDEAGTVSDADSEAYRLWLIDTYPRVIDSGLVAASGFTRFIAERYL